MMNFLFCWTILKIVISSPFFVSPEYIFLVLPVWISMNLTSLFVERTSSLLNWLNSKFIGYVYSSYLAFCTISFFSTNSNRFTRLEIKQTIPWSIKLINLLILALLCKSIVWMHWSERMSHTLIEPESSALKHIGVCSIVVMADTSDLCPINFPRRVESW